MELRKIGVFAYVLLKSHFTNILMVDRLINCFILPGINYQFQLNCLKIRYCSKILIKNALAAHFQFRASQKAFTLIDVCITDCVAHKTHLE